MKPAPFEYHDPRTLEDALALLAALPEARVLAGGQSLMPMLNMRVMQPANLIDLNRVEGLSYIHLEGEVLEVGAMTRQRDLESNEVIKRVFPLLQEAVSHVGHRQTRNRGTLGGSLCQLDPSAELVTVAAAVGATVVAASKSGRRAIPFEEFPRELLTPAIAPDEIVVAVRFPLWKSGHGYAFEEFARRHGDFAIASAAVLLEAAGGRITRASVTVGGVESRPRQLATGLTEAVSTAELLERVMQACDTLDAMSDPYVSGEYRRRLALVMVERALERAHARITKN